MSDVYRVSTGQCLTNTDVSGIFCVLYIGYQVLSGDQTDQGEKIHLCGKLSTAESCHLTEWARTDDYVSIEILIWYH